MSGIDDLRRFLSLERRLLERLSTRVEPFEHGTLFLDEDVPERYDSNFLRVERPLQGVDAGLLLEASDRILGAEGLAHREVVIHDETEGRRLAPAFREHGYGTYRNLIMVRRRPADRRPDVPVEELRFRQVRSLLEERYRREPWAPSERVVEAFTEQHAKFERVIGARFFAVRLEGKLAGGCELYLDGSDAQVEHVGTLEEHRGRGVARSVVLRAAEVAHQAGAEHVFIVADEADWPAQLYARLGFEQIGIGWQFIRPPAGETAPVTGQLTG